MHEWATQSALQTLHIVTAIPVSLATFINMQISLDWTGIVILSHFADCLNHSYVYFQSAIFFILSFAPK